MKQQIDNLIANTLLDEKEIHLPSVGTLILARQAAKMLSKKSIQPPFHQLRYTSEERGVSIISCISQVASISAERATDIYEEWLSQSYRNGVLTINGVCIVEKGNVTTDNTFENMANPKGRNAIKVNPRTNYLIYIIAGLCVGFAVGIAGYVLHSNGAFDNLLATEKVAPPSEAFENTTEQVATTTEPTTEVVEIAPATEQSIEQVVEQSQPEEVTTISGPIILPMQSGSSYAVWGVYDELKNAESAKNWLAVKYPEIDANIYQYDARYMVALCELPTRSECGRMVSAWKAQSKSFSSVWVYTR